MSLSKAVLILCGVLALTACGSSTSSEPASKPQQAAAPPAVEAVDEPAPEAGWEAPSTATSTSTTMCLGDPASRCVMTPDEEQKARQMEQVFEHAVTPLRGSEPRAIAQLRLSSRGPNARARLVTWRARSDKLCIETDEENGNDSGDGGPSGPCVPGLPCAKMCLDLSGSSGSDGVYTYLLSGVVSSKAYDLRVTLDDGRVEDFGLTARLVPGFPEYRVFMLDLGRGLYRRLELRRDDQVIAEETHSPSEIKMTRCGEINPPVHPSQGDASREFDQCVHRAAPK